jgi:hypothetical protein
VTDSLIFATIEESAKTAALSVTKAPIGKGGKNWVTETRPGNLGELPPYIQNIRNAIMRHGRPESEATGIAIGVVQNWASGRGGVKGEVKAAAAKALAEWEALKAKNAARKGADATLREGAGVGCTVPVVSDQGVMSVFEEVDTSRLAMPKARHRDGQFTNVGRKVTGRGKPFASMMDDLAKQGHVKNVPGKGGVPEVTIGTSPDSGGIGGWMFGSMPDTFATSVALGGLGEGLVKSSRHNVGNDTFEHYAGTKLTGTLIGRSYPEKVKVKRAKRIHAVAIVKGRDVHLGHHASHEAAHHVIVARVNHSGKMEEAGIDWDRVVEEVREPARPSPEVLAEQEHRDLVRETLRLQERTIDTSKREELAKKGQAIKSADGKISYPIENAKDLESAAVLARSGHGDVPKAKALIAKMSKKLGVKNPLEEADQRVGTEAHLLRRMRKMKEGNKIKVGPSHMIHRKGGNYELRDGGGKLVKKVRDHNSAELAVPIHQGELRHVLRESSSDRMQEEITGRKRKLLEGMSDGHVVPIHGHDVQHFAQLQASGHVTHVGPGFSKARITRKGKAALELKEHAEALAELELLLEGDGPRDYGTDAWSGAVARAKSLNQGEVMRFPDGTAIGRHATGDGRDAWSVGTPATWREGNLSYGAPHRTPERAVKAAMETSAGSTDPESLGGEQSYYRGMQVQANGNGLRFAGVSPETGNPLVSHPNSPTFKPQEVDWSVLKPNSDTIYQRA